MGGDLAVGPTFEFRTANFKTAELAGGVAGVLSGGDFGAIGTLGGAYAWRDGDEDGAVVTGSLAYGLVHVRTRSVASTTLYVSFRHAVTGPSADEITAGIAMGGGVLDFIARLGRL